MATLGKYGELHIATTGTINVFGHRYSATHRQMIPSNAITDFRHSVEKLDKVKEGKKPKKAELVEKAIIVLMEYQEAITKHTIRAVLEVSAGCKVGDSLISKIARHYGLWTERKQGFTFYRWLA